MMGSITLKTDKDPRIFITGNIINVDIPFFMTIVGRYPHIYALRNFHGETLLGCIIGALNPSMSSEMLEKLAVFVDVLLGMGSDPDGPLGGARGNVIPLLVVLDLFSAYAYNNGIMEGAVCEKILDIFVGYGADPDIIARNETHFGWSPRSWADSIGYKVKW